MNRKLTGLYVITDTRIQSRYSHIELAGFALEGGANIIQIRDKSLDTRSLIGIASQITRMCEQYNAICILNDRTDIAAAAGTHGVHLGQNDLPISEARNILGNRKIIGGSASTPEEAETVEKAGADYIGFGHIYETATKEKAYPPRGTDMLQEVCEKVRLPVFAIGGVNSGNAREVMESGASGVVICSEICTAENPEAVVRKIKSVF